jgi:hypothetical protein
VSRALAAVSRDDVLWKPLGHPSWADHHILRLVGPGNTKHDVPHPVLRKGYHTTPSSEGGGWKAAYMTWLRAAVSQFRHVLGHTTTRLQETRYPYSPTQSISTWRIPGQSGHARRLVRHFPHFYPISRLAMTHTRITAHPTIAHAQSHSHATLKPHTRSGTGKSAILRRYAHDQFEVYPSPTIGAEYERRCVEWQDKRIQVCVYAPHLNDTRSHTTAHTTARARTIVWSVAIVGLERTRAVQIAGVPPWHAWRGGGLRHRQQGDL